VHQSFVIAIAIAVGFACGLRTFTPPALISWLAIWGWMPLAGSPFWFVGTNAFAIAITALAALELVADKLPKTPARIHAMPLIARVLSGGISAGAFAFTAGVPWVLGSVSGAVGSVAGAFSGYYLRRFLVRRSRIPDFFVALVEDFVTIAGLLYAVHNFFHSRV
jgi:uncharacterized membrane protein